MKRALPTAKVGGPATTGPRSAKAAAFLRQFLEHCARGTNAVTGKAGAPLDFVELPRQRLAQSGGRPRADGHGLRAGRSGSRLRDRCVFPGLASLPVIVSEWDPEGCAACSARTHPQNAYRNTTLYPANRAVVFSAALKLADKYKINLEGLLTWAFEFEGQPYFDGFRTLATNGIDKPVLNFFRMAGLMGGSRVKVAQRRSGRRNRRSTRWPPRAATKSPSWPGTTTTRTRPRPPRRSKWLSKASLRPLPACSSSTTASTSATATPTPPGRRWARRRTPARNSTRASKPPASSSSSNPRAGCGPAREPPDIEFSLPRQGISLLHLSW